jgi:hypothetical protein
MNRKTYFILFALAIIIIVIATLLILKTEPNMIKSAKDLNMLENVPCKLENGMEGNCVSREKCDDPGVLSISERSSDGDECGDELNIICCGSNKFEDPPTVIDQESDEITSEKTNEKTSETTSEKAKDKESKMKLLNHKKCGKVYSNRIVGGLTAQPGDFPFYVLLKYKINDKFLFLCGGSLISGE